MPVYNQQITLMRRVDDPSATKAAVLADLMRRAGSVAVEDFELTGIDVWKVKIRHGEEERDYDDE